MFNLSKFSPRRFDWVLLISSLLLLCLGLVSIYSVDLSRGTGLIFFKKQLLSAAIGLTVLFIVSAFQHTFFRSYAKFIYLVSLSLLVGVLIFGTTIRGTRGWFTFARFSFQPAEVAKVALIFILAYVIYSFGRRYHQPLFFFGTAVITFLLVGLVMLQPDLGSALMIASVWFGIMLLVGLRKMYLISLALVVAVASVVGWQFFLQPYQKERVLTFIDPKRNTLGSGYNLNQAIIAVGAGQVFGRGLGFGSQSQLRFLPEAQTDFIFSVIAEELGFAGVIGLITLYVIILWRLVLIIKNARDDFVGAAVSGIAVLFFAQFFFNVGANLGLVPITGVTLPLVSYGGSSLIITLFLVGVAESMAGTRY